MTSQRAIREALAKANAANGAPECIPSTRTCASCGLAKNRIEFNFVNGHRVCNCIACETVPVKRAPPAPVSEVVAKPTNHYPLSRAKRDALAKERRARVAIVVAPAVLAPNPVVVQRMTADDLRLFARPIQIRDLPGGKSRGGRYEWPALVAQAEVDGLLRSPGKSTTWELTDAGWEAVTRG